MSDPLIGRVLSGRFQIASFIREGGMASIYCGVQQTEPHHVALKIMHPELARDPQFVRRFRREARAAARLRHPNVVEIIEYGDDRDVVYIAMELVVGNDLVMPLTRDGPFSEARAANVIIQVCDALSCAHAQNVVHRDLKPENVMLIVDRQNPMVEVVKVLDFGIAKILDDQPSATVLDPNRETPSSVRSMLTRVGMIVGTPAYMSPEQGRAEPVDLRTDIYSAGVLLYELLTGLPPFDGETPMQVVMRHVNDSPAPPSTILPVHPGLEALIMKALAKWPRDRFQSAAAMAAELRQLMPELATVGRGAQSSRAYADFAPDDDGADSVVKTAVKAPSLTPPRPPPSGDEDDEVATLLKPPQEIEGAEEPAPDSAPNPNPGMPTITFSLTDMLAPEDEPSGDDGPTGKSEVPAGGLERQKQPAAAASQRIAAPTPVSLGQGAPAQHPPRVVIDVGRPAPSPHPPAPAKRPPTPGPREPAHVPAEPSRAQPRAADPVSGSPAPTPRSADAPTPRQEPARSPLQTAKMPRDTAKMAPAQPPESNGAPVDAALQKPSTPPMKIGETLGRAWEPPETSTRKSPSPPAPPSPPPADFYEDPRTRRLMTVAIALGAGLLLTLLALIGLLVVLLTR